MIIDVHTHLGTKLIVATAEQLVASMDVAGISRSLVFAGRMLGLANERLFDALKGHEDRLVAVGSVSPLSPERPSLEKVEGWLKKGRITALKFYPGYEYYYPHSQSVRPYLELLARYGKPAIFHSGDTFSKAHAGKLKYALPIHIDELAVELPELKIVIAHLGYPWQIDAAEVVYKNPNVYVDCSGFVYDDFDADKEAHFAEVVRQYRQVAGSFDRVLFGTDWPISRQSSYLDVAQGIFHGTPGVFADHAIKLFGLE